MLLLLGLLLNKTNNNNNNSDWLRTRPPGECQVRLEWMRLWLMAALCLQSSGQQKCRAVAAAFASLDSTRSSKEVWSEETFLSFSLFSLNIETVPRTSSWKRRRPRRRGKMKEKKGLKTHKCKCNCDCVQTDLAVVQQTSAAQSSIRARERKGERIIGWVKSSWISHRRENGGSVAPGAREEKVSFQQLLFLQSKQRQPQSIMRRSIAQLAREDNDHQQQQQQQQAQADEPNVCYYN